MTEVTTQFAIDYLLDDCDDCPENDDGECLTKSHCFEVKRLAIKALKQYGALQEIRQEIEQERWCDKDTRISKNANSSGIEVALAIIDKHIKESNDEWDRVTMIDVNGNTHKVTFKKDIEDMGDYPDEIPNQFDNLTGSMNV